MFNDALSKAFLEKGLITKEQFEKVKVEAKPKTQPNYKKEDEKNIKKLS